MSDQFLLPDLINPRLEFGVSLDKVCERGILHPGLRELFLKAYLSASAGDECPGKEPFKGLSRPPYVLEALRAGPEGQGRLVDRMSLKLRLESGKWIIATQTPAGTPLWLLRHYLGCLPEPLLHGSYWGEIAITCGSALCLKSNNYNSEILKQIVTALKSLPRENYSTLETLVLLIRNLSTAIPTNNSAAAITLNEEALEALSVYFTAAIISRPYRPGLYTTVDNEHKPLLLFLSEHWLEVQRLCQHTGISRYRRTCESRYKFAGPDTEVTITPAENTHARKSNPHLSKNITKPDVSSIYSSVENAGFLKKKCTKINNAVTLNIQRNEIQGDSLSTTVHTPKDVYFIPYNAEYIHESITDEKVSGKVMEDSSDTINLADEEFDHCHVHLKVPKIDGLEGLHLCDVLKDESNNILKVDVQRLVREYKGEAITLTGIHEAFKYDGIPSQKEVMGTVNMKINGTQTFECEFCEDRCTMEINKSQEKMNELRVSPSRVEVLENSDRQENNPAEVGIGLKNDFELFKIYQKRAVIPLTKSTALLIKNLPSSEKIVHLAATQLTMSDFIDLISNGSVINKVEQAITPKEDTFTTKTDEDCKTLTNPVEDERNLRYQKSSSNGNDFVSELKNNFRQGRKMPSDAKLSSQIMFLNEGGSPRVSHPPKFFCQNGKSHRPLEDSGSTRELFPNKSCIPIPSTNSL